MRIARGDGRRLCLVLLARAECAPDRLAGFFVVALCADGLAIERWDADGVGFFGAAGESLL
jgi:hypothetical protein